MYRKQQSSVNHALKPMGAGVGRRRSPPLIFRAPYGGKCQSSSPGRITPRKEALYSLNRRNLGPIHRCEVLENRILLVPVRSGNLDRPAVSLATSQTTTSLLKYMNTSKFDRVLGYEFKNALDKAVDSAVSVHLYL